MSKDKQPRKEIVEVTLSDSDEETQDTSVSNIETVVSTGTEELVCEVDPAAVQNGDTDGVDTDEEVVVTYVGPPKKDENPSSDPRSQVLLLYLLLGCQWKANLVHLGCPVLDLAVFLRIV